MIKKISLKNLLFTGFLIELLIFGFSYIIAENWGEIFRLSARYSGRLSLVVYLICFYQFTFSFLKKKSEKKLKDSIIVFCFLHYIHFIYLTLAVYLNNIPIIPARLAGGFIAYLMILIYPFIISKIKKIIYHLIYFYYVGIVMAVTILGRVRGDFEGAEPEFFHYLGLASVILGFIYFTSVIIRSKKSIIK
tara:strand:+ start:197 stop:769 length:573 start_codon:yes stop_codon:yes gene_type:complete